MFTPEFEVQVRLWAESRLPKDRMVHVQGVVATAEQLARLYVPDEVIRARLAGWMHDVAKHLDDKTLLEMAESHDWAISEVEQQVPMLLHGVVGYFLAADKFGFSDDQLKTACAYHTTGAPSMNTLDKVVFLADLIEPTRDFEAVHPLRRLAEENLDKAVLYSLDITADYLIQRQRIIDPRLLLLRNQLLGAGIRYPKG